MMMTIRCAQWQIAGMLLWTSLMLLQFSLGKAAGPQDDALTSDLHSPALSRPKREWIWNTFIVYEEKPPQTPPETVGKLKNNLTKNRNTQFKLMGEGANDIFVVNDHGDIFVLARLDREKKSSYKLTAQILDRVTKETLEEDAEFIIQVQDINDNKPVFSEIPIGLVNERSPKGTPVLTIKTTDADDPTSPNGMIGYKLLSEKHVFSIERTTGVISTKVDNLDRETKSEYKLIVEAADIPGSEGAGQTATTTVTVNINDINDNMATFKEANYYFRVKEDEREGFKIGIFAIEDRDEKQNKKPKFTVQSHQDIFYVELDDRNDGVLTLGKPLDFETKPSYTFTVTVTEDDVAQPPDNHGFSQLTTAKVVITVEDVDEPPVFSQAEYNFSIFEGPIKNKIVGSVSAKDMDKTSHGIKYSIDDANCPVTINEETGQLFLKRELDREFAPSHTFQVTAQEKLPGSGLEGQKSYAIVNIKVLDINDNKPELVNGSYVYICESDKNGTVIGIIGANDMDENPGKFQFTLAKKSSNFSLHDNSDNTATIKLIHGGFSTESSTENILEIEITDGGSPPQKSITPLHIRVCTCQTNRRAEYCMSLAQTGVSASALIAILLCILTILVIVILFALRKRYQKETLVSLGKAGGEIHEQLVTYDEEGGGEMDTNGYDVSILSSACYNGSMRPAPPPAMYAVVKKPPACKGDMAVMIEVKKDEADHDRDGIPYDTLHVYGYEGPESLAGSLSSLDTSSVGSNQDYDFLNDWGPRFRTLAQLYGVDGSDSDESY